MGTQDALSAEYGVKAGYGWVIAQANAGVYTPELGRIPITVTRLPEAALANDARIQQLDTPAPDVTALSVPRYDPFTGVVAGLVRQGVVVLDIAGNQNIALTALAPRAVAYRSEYATLITSLDILSQPERKRLAIHAPVRSLAVVFAEFDRQGIEREHIYDY